MLHVDPDTREQWDEMLIAPLPGGGSKQAATPASADTDAASFMATMQAMKG